jgi:hypothetical protein
MLKLALLTGINNYTYKLDAALRGCVNDAKQMRDFFDSLGYGVKVLVDVEATDTNIIEFLQDFHKQVTDAGQPYRVAHWHSSHGSHYNLPGGGLGECICCSNIKEGNGDWAQGIIKDTQYRDLLNSFPDYGEVEAGLDTCFSGGMDRLLRAGRINRFLHNPSNTKELLRLTDPDKGMHQGLNANIILWTACSAAQESADAYINGAFHGEFTYRWVEQWKKNPRLTRVQLLVNTKAAIRKDGEDQVPRLKAWQKQQQEKVGG